MILVGGGSRSGKSRVALDMLRAAGERRAFIATARTLDAEMEERVARHRRERERDIVTFEEPLEVARLVGNEGRRFDGIVVDCLTLWLSNLLMAEREPVEEYGRELIEAAAEASARVILVTNEVGCGIVPENELARRFRDEAGWLNQWAARQAAEVHWMVFGIGMRVK